MPQSDVEEVGQYDLLKLGFLPLEENSGGDVMNSPYESWVPEAFGTISQSAEQSASYQYGLVPQFYRDLMSEVDSNRDGKVTAEEIRQALAVRDPLVKNVVNRLAVKHHSEWCKGRSTGRWEEFYKDLDPLEIKYCEKWQADLEWMSRVPPFDKDEAVWHFHPVVFLDAVKQERNKQVIFPLTVKPENDPRHIWSRFDWRDMHQSNMAAYGTNRNGGARKHAARDLYTKPYEKVVAICDGKILGTNPFYDGTNEIAIFHTTSDKRKFIVRYGELDPSSIKVKIGDEVKQGQHIGNTGKLINPKTSQPLLKIGGVIVYMLHLELYTGKVSYDINPPLTDKSKPPFLRRSDLVDPIDILSEGYANTFNNNVSKCKRLDITTLHTSENGKAFIKGWEILRLNAYNDSHGYCTIGYGHLIDKKRCELISLPIEYQGEISQNKANEIFDIDLVRFENGVKRNINVGLHQYEFDALVSLLFNCGEFFFSSDGAPNLLRLINAENYESAADEFLDITNGGEPGLVKRRASEKNLFTNNIYDSNN
ncbi:glycoside hydrolase family protein [Atlantibacter hermannii]|uniref:glycoside hydrolase family protein n=1 Tax=Atlantibacter hermannii TaxID=565 RepID=UPI0028AF6E1F|nr:glycoside hydrolase family protein [Atlantibacter hermannii]